MIRRMVNEAYDPIKPNEAEKVRMLDNILSHASGNVSIGKGRKMRKSNVGKLSFIAALIVVMIATIATASGMKLRVREKTAFTSKDGTIDFMIDLDDEVYSEVYSTIEVVPHFLTGEDAKRVATALFGDAVFFETEPLVARRYSKSEIQAKLDRWKQYTTEEALFDLFANENPDTEYLKQVLENVNAFIERYESLLETAPEENQHDLCDWTFKNGIVYMAPEEEWDNYELSACNQEVSTMLEINGIPYEFRASQRDEGRFRVNNIHAQISGGMSPHAIDDLIFTTQLCRTAEPTEEQLLAVKEKAETMLRQMKLGDWLIDVCEVVNKGSGAHTEYVIKLSAVPVFNTIPAIRREQLNTLWSHEKEESYYYFTDVQFEFSANGDLISFDMYSPVDVKETSHDAEPITFEDLYEIAKANLIGSTYSDYSYIPEAYGKTINVGCRITIRDIDYSLNRTSEIDNRVSFVYSLGFSLSGDIEYYNKDNGEVIDRGKNRTVLVLDGIDGTFLGRG